MIVYVYDIMYTSGMNAGIPNMDDSTFTKLGSLIPIEILSPGLDGDAFRPSGALANWKITIF